MIKITKENKNKVIETIKEGRIDAAEISRPNFIDEIILKMKKLGVSDELSHIIDEKRKGNATIPLNLIWELSIAAKMKTHTSLSDIPYAIMVGIFVLMRVG